MSTLKINKQWLLIVSLCAFSITCFFVVRALFANRYSVDVTFTPAPFNESNELNYATRFGSVADDYKTRAANAEKIKPEGRNLFSEYEIQQIPKEPFEIQKIVFEPFVFMYMGFIEKSTAEFIAQINWASQTYFVRKGDAIKEWVILEITKDRVIARDTNGEEMELPLQQKVLSKKPFAQIKIYRTGNERKITVGDTVEGHKVLDITRDTVILTSDSGVITVYK
jgi:sRNA-binding protein